MNIEKIGLAVREGRKKKGWSQQQLAERAGLNRTTIGAFERGDFADLGIRKVQRLLELLGKTLEVKHKGLPTLDDLREGSE